MKVLLADDEEELTRAVGAILSFNDYEVEIVNNGEDAFKKAIENNYDVIVLDVMMPKKSGIEVTQELREKNVDTPILMLTAKAEVEDKVEGLDKGANDYLTKPFEKEELLARLRALIRNDKNKIRKIKIGNVTLNKEENQLYTEKASFHLNSKETQLMEFLIGNQERIIPTEDLKNKVWGESEEDYSVVEMYMSYLQNKFEALGANVKIIENNGYSLEKLL